MMIYKFTKYLSLLFLLFAVFLSSQKLNLDSIEKEIIQNNRIGKYMVSQKKLSELLLQNKLSNEEKAYLLYFLAATYRSVGDYPMCIDNLNRSMTIAKNLPADNLLKMRIDYEFAFAYFDSNDFSKARVAMDHITASNYRNPFPEDQAYILMQDGYLLLLQGKLQEAESKYNDALPIMEKVSYCNLPIVYTKMMSLYSRKKNVAMAEKVYKESLKVSDSCNILKYKIFTVAEMERVYRENNLYGNAYLMATKLDSLRKLESIDNTVSEMHMTDKVFTEKEQLRKERSDIVTMSILLSVLILLAAFAIFYFYSKSLKSKRAKLEMEDELEQIKQDIDSGILESQENTFSKKHFFLDSKDLTDRQKELLVHMADGLSNREIGEKLFISENTVKYHIRNIYAILKIKDRKEFFKKLRNS